MKARDQKPKDKRNLSTIVNRGREPFVEEFNFSTSKNHSFSSEENVFKKKLKKKPKKGKKLEVKVTPEAQTTTTTLLHQRGCELCSGCDGNSQNTNSRHQRMGSENTKKSVSHKMNQLDMLSNKTCSCFTMKTRTYNLMADSQFPSSYQDVNNLTDVEIQRLIQKKMKILDEYNFRLEKKKNSTNYMWVFWMWEDLGFGVKILNLNFN